MRFSKYIYSLLFVLISTQISIAQNAIQGNSNPLTDKDSLTNDIFPQQKLLSGNAVRIDKNSFNSGLFASPELLIQGRVAGVQVNSINGEPGAMINTVIRGVSSLYHNNPLFVIDGMPMNIDEGLPVGIDLGIGATPSRNFLNFINLADVEFISIIKDGTAAIYGARASQGVVLITTKGGSGTHKELSYSTAVSVSKTRHRFDLLNRDQFLSYFETKGIDPADMDYGEGTDWQNEVHQTAVSQQHALSFANSYKSGNYRASVNYHDQEGIIRSSGMKRMSGRLNANHSFLDNRLRVGANLNIAHIIDDHAPLTTAPAQGNLLSSAFKANPTWPVDPTLEFVGSVNPASIPAYTREFTETTVKHLNLDVRYQVNQQFGISANGGFQRSASSREKAISPLLRAGNGNFGNGRAATIDHVADNSFLQWSVDYGVKMGNGKLAMMLGHRFQKLEVNQNHTLGWGFSSNGTNGMLNDLSSARNSIAKAIGDRPYQQYTYMTDGAFQTPDFWIATLTSMNAVTSKPELSIKTVTGGSSNAITKLQSFFGTITYDLPDKFIFTATLTRDGSSKFNKDDSYGIFPSGSFTWKILAEKNNKLDVRFSYGVTGNQDMDRDVYKRVEQFPSVAPPINSGGEVTQQGYITNSNNPSIRWSETAHANIRVDFSLNDRFSGGIDFYRKNTSDILAMRQVAQPSTGNFVWDNLDGRIINQGIELTVGYHIIREKDLGFSFNANAAINKNLFEGYEGTFDAAPTPIPGNQIAFVQRITGGQPLFAYYLREFKGFENGFSVYNDFSQTFVGKSALPTKIMGFDIRARYKDLSFEMYFNGQFGHYLYNHTANALFIKSSLGNGYNVTEEVAYSEESEMNEANASTKFLEKGDYLRLQNVIVAYRFNINKKFLDYMRLHLSAQNLLIFTGYSGSDPEVNLNSSASTGIDYTAYPRARSVMLGLDVKF